MSTSAGSERGNLTDYLEPGLRAVLVGTAGCDGPGERRHYYAGAGNNFWLLLHESGLTPVRLSPEDDLTLPSYGVGLTDLIWIRTPGPDGRPVDRYDLPDFVAKIDKYRPAVVAFTSKTAAAAYARAARERPPATSARSRGPSPTGRRSCCPGRPGPTTACPCRYGSPLARPARLHRDGVAARGARRAAILRIGGRSCPPTIRREPLGGIGLAAKSRPSEASCESVG